MNTSKFFLKIVLWKVKRRIKIFVCLTDIENRALSSLEYKRQQMMFHLILRPTIMNKVFLNSHLVLLKSAV